MSFRTGSKTLRCTVAATGLVVVAALAAPAATAATAAQPGSVAPRQASAASHSGHGRPPVHVRVIAINDLHGNLVPPAGSSGRVVLADGTTVDAGGAAYLATHVQELEAAAPHNLLVSAGDNIGASPLVSGLFHDEPTIEFLNDIGMDASVVGNHEFDEGYKELRRMQRGGCHPVDGCQFRPTFDGADFPFLGANVSFTNGRPALLPFTVKRYGGIPIGIIGVTLKDLPSVVTADAIEGLTFGDEVKAINRTANLLDRFGIKAQIVVMHQGDSILPLNGPDACNITPGNATRIATTATAKVDAFFTGHSHQQYNCVVNDPRGHPRPVIQGLSFGRLLSVVDLTLNPRTRDVIRSKTVAHNEIVTRDVTPEPTVQALVDDAVELSAPIANRPVGSITADIVRSAPVPSGESPLGDVIADAQLAGTTGAAAQIAITNPGGIRADLVYAGSSAGEGDGVVTYGEAFGVQPFANIMQTMSLTGAQLDAALEQQWTPTVRILQISSSLHYTMDLTKGVGDRVSGLELNGVAIDPNATYRVSVNNFLAGGGDDFTVFTQGTDITVGPIDVDAFTAYLTAHPGLAPPPANRITLVQ